MKRRWPGRQKQTTTDGARVHPASPDRTVAVVATESYNHTPPSPLVATLTLPGDTLVTSKSGQIRIGIGGWNYEPWRGVFYPEGLAQAKELAYAASQLTSIEINPTSYGSQKPDSFRKWAATVPNGFVFSVKGPRFATTGGS